MAAAIGQVIPDAKRKFEAPAGNGRVAGEPCRVCGFEPEQAASRV